MEIPARKIFNPYPQIYIITFLFMVAALLVWQAKTRIEVFHQHQRQIAEGTVSGVMQKLNHLLLDLHRVVGLFADSHQQVFRELIRKPENGNRRGQIKQLIQQYFPEAIAFSLTNSLGDDLLNSIAGRVTEICRADIREYVQNGYQQTVYLHPGPDGYHFDIMVPFYQVEQSQGGVFFISFRPDMLSRLLASSEVATGHRLFLVTQDKEGRSAIEIAAKGFRGHLGREPTLTPEELARLEYAMPVPGTLWQLVDIPVPEFYTEQGLNVWIQVCSLFMIFLGTGLLMLYLIKREGNQRQNAEDSLRESHATLNAVFEGIGDPMYIKDVDGRYRMVNSAFAEMTKKSPQEIPGHSDQQLFPVHTAQRFFHADRSVLERGEKSLAEEHHTAKGERFCCLVTRTPLKDVDENLTGIVGIRHDITELKLAEERIRMHERKLAHVDRLNIVGEMASSIAHEINQPLGAVANCAQACLRMVSSNSYDTEKLLAALSLANKQAQRAGKIVRQIRDFTRKDTRRHALIDLKALIEETVAFFQPKAREHSTTVSVQVADHLPKICGDPIQIEQVMLNLMFNGIEAMKEAGSSLKELKISCILLEGAKVDVTIKDTGPGIDAETAERIFEPFFTTKARGMGLGLAISRTIIESHTGHLWVEVDKQGGAEFHFTLPVTEET